MRQAVFDGRSEIHSANWYPACAASRLANEPLAANVLGEQLALFRDEGGTPHALLDRCCHRGVQLSKGKICNSRLACPYHGWEYDGSGACVRIPSLTAGHDIPKAVGVRSFPCVEQDSYIWVWMGDGAPSPARPESIACFDAMSWQQGSMEYACAAMKLIENNLDWCHPAFTHPNTHPQWFAIQAQGFREYAFEVRVTERGLIEFAPPAADTDSPVPDQAFTISFELPCRVHLAGPAPKGRFAIVLHCVPAGPSSSRLEWMLGANGPHDIVWSDEEPIVLAQDRIVETSQHWYEGDSADFERSVEADYPTLLARRIVALARKGEWTAKRSQLTQRRLVTVRS